MSLNWSARRTAAVWASMAAFGFPLLAAEASSDASRVESLLKQMTLDEQMSLIRGAIEDPSTYQGQAGCLAGIARLGIPGLRLADGPHGVLTKMPSGLPPSTLALAATFDRTVSRDVGQVIGRNARARGIDVVLEPFINMARDPNTGRASNTYGEDPLLTGQIGAALIEGIQSQDVMAQAKHYIAYDGAGSVAGNVIVDPQTFHEIYLAPFDDAVRAGVSSLMCAHGKIGGIYSCENSETLNDVLKGELGFKGFVTSDWGASHGAESLSAGLDMEMPGESVGMMAAMFPAYFRRNAQKIAPAPAGMPVGPVFAFIPEEEPPMGLPAAGAGMLSIETLEEGKSPSLGVALEKGTVQEAQITEAARRILREMVRFGYLDGKQKHTVTDEPVAANAPVLQLASERSAVLLKNVGDVLPLKKEELGNTVFIGPGAMQTMALVDSGEKALGWPARQLGVVAVLGRGIDGIPAQRVQYAVANDMTGVPVPATVWSHQGQPGLLRTSGGTAPSQVDPTLDFTLLNNNALPMGQSFSWTGDLEVPSEGDYEINLQILGASGSFEIDGKRVGGTPPLDLHGDVLQAGQDNVLPTTDGLDNVRTLIRLGKGRHAIVVKVQADPSGSPLQIRLAWKTPEKKAADRAAAVEAASKAGKAVVFAWSRGRPDSFRLTPDQDQLIADIARVNPNTVVVLNTDRPIDMPWLSKVKAVLEFWYTGDEGGWATARVLIGQVSPAGRLPFTWPRKLGDSVAYDAAHPERSNAGINGVTTYSEGLFMGYRHFDKERIEPLFPFGYGLSYSHFDYSALHVVPSKDGGIDVSFTVRNSGGADSDEVPQIYLGPPMSAPSGAQFAVRSLIGFDRVHVKAQQARTVRIHVPPRRLQYWDTASRGWKRAGPRSLFVAASSRDSRLSGPTP